MAIKTYQKDGYTCFKIQFTSRSRIAGINVRLQCDLGAVTYTEAKREYEKLKKEAVIKRIEKERNGLVWRDLLSRWYKDVVLNGPYEDSVSKRDSHNALQMHTKPWMLTPLDQLRPMSMRLIFNEMEKKELSKGRMKSVRSAVNTVFDWARLERIIPAYIESPARGVSIPKVETKMQPILNRDEIKLFLRKAREVGHEYYYLWAVAVSTGCRSGELWALRWTDVSLETRMISITKSFSSRLGYDKSTKTKDSRQIPINAALEMLLMELKLKTFSTGYVLPRITSWRRGEASKVSRSFCQALGLPEITFHATRACFAVQCLVGGLDIVTTMKLGGWKNVKSFQHYVRLAGVEIQGATDVLDLIP
ncbi:tyrosine-type recombinase/integrase [Bdellovibrio sp. HCB117]|uniref:tyrosine-type recombinase/integrase n=1 Tax=Bdellovibrio sp. HCB117 TaxID=3394359 RepID=UPI0039B49DE3